VILVGLAYPVVTHRGWGSVSLPAQYNVISNFGRQQIFETGSLPPEVTGPTFVGDLRDNALHDSMNIILSSEYNIVTGTTDIREAQRIHELFPWHYLVLVPLSIYLFVRVYQRLNEAEFSTIDAVVLFGFVLFPLSTRPRVAFRGLNSRSAAAIGLFHLLVVLVLLDATSDRKQDKRRIAVYLVMLTAYFPLHHTWSYYLLLVIGSLGVFGLLIRERFLSRLLVSGAVIWSISAAYLAQNQIEEPLRLYSEFETRLASFGEFLEPAPVSNVDPSYLYAAGGNIDTLRFLNALVIISLFGLFGLLLLYRLYRRVTSLLDLNFGAIYGGLTVTAVGLFVWQGISGVRGRILQISVPLGRVLLGYLLVSVSSRWLKNGVRGLAVVTVCLCLVTFAFFPAGLSYQISPAEGAAVEAVGTHTPTDRAIYSDYRLAPPLLLYGPVNVHTLDARDQEATQTEAFLDGVYYGPTAPQRQLDELIGESSYTVLLTDRQTEIAVLDVGLNRFRPVTEADLRQWQRVRQFNRVYSNGQSHAYARRG